MKKITLLTGILLITGSLIYAQQPKDNWGKWNNLIGEWVGEGNGQPGQGEGKFSFQKDLGENILVRKNHTVFPAQAGKEATVHDDLLIVYPSGTDGSQEAIYFDNEGHTIKYAVSFKDNSIVLTSAANQGPRFRLTYEIIDAKTVNIVFEMASPQAPEEFRKYLAGKAFKK
jgi:hypothetical protein